METDEKRARLKEAAMAILDGAPGHRMQITNLNKALFYLDLMELLAVGETITGTTYIALDAGPVVAKYQQRLVDPLVEDGFARQDTVGDSKPLVMVRPLDDFQFLDAGTRERARKVAQRIATMTAAAVSDLSHENPGWRLAYAEWRADEKHRVRPINMLIALQQLGDDDKWLDAPLGEDLRRVFAAAASEGGESW